jgi:hypothetical protein
METQQVPFYKGELLVTRDDNGVSWVSVRSLCQALGISHVPQERKMKSHPVLQSNVTIMVTMDKAGRDFKMFCVKLDYVNYWLSTISPHKTAVPVEDLKIYQDHCAKAIQAHFAYVPKDNTMSGIYSQCLTEDARHTARMYYEGQIETSEYVSDEEVDDACLFNGGSHVCDTSNADDDASLPHGDSDV